MKNFLIIIAALLFGFPCMPTRAEAAIDVTPVTLFTLLDMVYRDTNTFRTGVFTYNGLPNEDIYLFGKSAFPGAASKINVVGRNTASGTGFEIKVYGNGVTLPDVTEITVIVDSDKDGTLGWINETTGQLELDPGDATFNKNIISINGGVFGDISILGYTPGQPDFELDSIEMVACVEDADCDDNVFCNGAETCSSGSCIDGIEPCDEGLCDEGADVCSEPAECQDDIDCDDGAFCNGAETCDSGACQSGEEPCIGDGTCDEDADVCSEPAECQDDIDCDDGAFCNGDETCDSGDCQSGDEPCIGDETCDEDADVCVDPAECLDDIDCDDGLFCNGEEICLVGSCVAGVTPCDESETCDETTDHCIPEGCDIEWDLDEDCDVDKDDKKLLKLWQKEQKVDLSTRHKNEKTEMKAAIGLYGDCELEWDLDNDCVVDKDDKKLLKLRQKEQKTDLKARHKNEKTAMNAAL